VGTDFPEEHLRAMYPNSSRDQKGQAERIIDRLRRAYKIGVKMAFGSDIVIDLPGKIDCLSDHKSKRRRSPNRRRFNLTRQLTRPRGKIVALMTIVFPMKRL
ncbi:MAG TPA: hypothetical protein VMM57_11680, partial [Bacteroidota bacterium]|nr:hypothetical protein [Bacteroidota bacterium]